MADPMVQSNAGNPPAAPLAGPQSAGSPDPAPAPVSAQQTAALFGGLRGGRKRTDGLPAGSAEARRADRVRDAERKRAQRLEQKARTEPPPLPAVAPATMGAGAPGTAGLDLQPGLAPAAFVAWDAETLRPIFVELVPTVEELAVGRLTAKAAKAQLPTTLIKEIASDAAWKAPEKRAMILAGPEVTAKWLNKSGLSAENKFELVLATALLSIVRNNVALGRKLDHFIAQKGAPGGPPAKPAEGAGQKLKP